MLRAWTEVEEGAGALLDGDDATQLAEAARLNSVADMLSKYFPEGAFPDDFCTKRCIGRAFEKEDDEVLSLLKRILT